MTDADRAWEHVADDLIVNIFTGVYYGCSWRPATHGCLFTAVNGHAHYHCIAWSEL